MGWFSADENIEINLNESTILVVCVIAVMIIYIIFKYVLKYHRLNTLNLVREIPRT